MMKISVTTTPPRNAAVKRHQEYASGAAGRRQMADVVAISPRWRNDPFENSPTMGLTHNNLSQNGYGKFTDHGANAQQLETKKATTT